MPSTRPPRPERLDIVFCAGTGLYGMVCVSPFIVYTVGREGSAVGMIRHEVILRIRPEVNREIIERTLREVVELFQGIPGVERVRYGVSNAASYRHALLAIDLTNELALHRFGRHPQHARAVRLIGRLAESSAVGSYLVTSDRKQS
jgi:hypothetical protein